MLRIGYCGETLDDSMAIGRRRDRSIQRHHPLHLAVAIRKAELRTRSGGIYPADVRHSWRSFAGPRLGFEGTAFRDESRRVANGHLRDLTYRGGFGVWNNSESDLAKQHGRPGAIFRVVPVSGVRTTVVFH